MNNGIFYTRRPRRWTWAQLLIGIGFFLLVSLVLPGCDNAPYPAIPPKPAFTLPTSMLPGADEPAPDPEKALSFAVMDNLHGKVLLDIDHNLSPALLDCEQQKIRDFRKWAQTIRDSRVRDEYMQWLDFAQSRLDLSRKTVEEDASAIHERQNNADMSAGERLAPTLPQPPDHQQCDPP